ncbi:hypothetical protein LJC45_02930 [Alistipes sp. OttesenSCG-928-B03]|nr:hypothetical protein [Alistipes sp. OttesenSCG-928-B03]
MATKKDMHYFHSSQSNGKSGFTASRTRPAQGFRPKDIVQRMMAGAPPPVGRNPVYIDPNFGVDPLARFEVPIEEMAEKAALATDRLNALKAAQEAQKKEVEKLKNSASKNEPPQETPLPSGGNV